MIHQNLLIIVIEHGEAIRKIKIYLHPTAQRVFNWTCDVAIVTGPHENRCKYHRWCEKRACKVDDLQKKVEDFFVGENESTPISVKTPI